LLTNDRRRHDDELHCELKFLIFIAKVKKSRPNYSKNAQQQCKCMLKSQKSTSDQDQTLETSLKGFTKLNKYYFFLFKCCPIIATSFGQFFN